MHSQDVQWDLTQIHCGSGMGSMLLLFLLVVLIVVGMKLSQVWRFARPFEKSLPENKSQYAALLGRTVTGLTRLMQLTFLVWAFFLTVHISRISRVAMDGLLSTRLLWWCQGTEVIGITKATLLVVMGAFLARWSVEKRLERIREKDSPEAGAVT